MVVVCSSTGLPLDFGREIGEVHGESARSRTQPSVYHGILIVMPKVMVSMPDDLLHEVDAEASRLRTTRSAVLRQFADSALRGRRADRAAAMRVLAGQAAPHGGAAAERVKATRPAV